MAVAAPTGCEVDRNWLDKKFLHAGSNMTEIVPTYSFSTSAGGCDAASLGETCRAARDISFAIVEVPEEIRAPGSTATTYDEDEDDGLDSGTDDEVLSDDDPEMDLAALGRGVDSDVAGGVIAAAGGLPPPLAGRSTPAHGTPNSLLDVLHSPKESGSRKRRRGMFPEDDYPHRLPTVARFSDDPAADGRRPVAWAASAAVPRPRRGYMQHQPNISHPLRIALVDWLVEVVEVYRFRIHTLYAAINYLDRFLSKITINRKVLQLTGVTCLMLASKYEEINPPSVEEFAFITDSTYSRNMILKMECAVLNTLKFELRVDSPLGYTEFMLLAADACDSARELSAFLIMLTQFDAEQYLAVDPVIIAAAAVVLALNSLHGYAVPPGLMYAFQDADVDFDAVATMTVALHRTHQAKNALSTSLCRMFSSMEHHKVARLRPALSTPVVLKPLRTASRLTMSLRPRKPLPVAMEPVEQVAPANSTE